MYITADAATSASPRGSPDAAPPSTLICAMPASPSRPPPTAAAAARRSSSASASGTSTVVSCTMKPARARPSVAARAAGCSSRGRARPSPVGAEAQRVRRRVGIFVGRLQRLLGGASALRELQAGRPHRHKREAQCPRGAAAGKADATRPLESTCSTRSARRPARRCARRRCRGVAAARGAGTRGVARTPRAISAATCISHTDSRPRRSLFFGRFLAEACRLLQLERWLSPSCSHCRLQLTRDGKQPCAISKRSRSPSASTGARRNCGAARQEAAPNSPPSPTFSGALTAPAASQSSTRQLRRGSRASPTFACSRAPSPRGWTTTLTGWPPCSAYGRQRTSPTKTSSWRARRRARRRGRRPAPHPAVNAIAGQSSSGSAPKTTTTPSIRLPPPYLPRPASVRGEGGGQRVRARASALSL